MPGKESVAALDEKLEGKVEEKKEGPFAKIKARLDDKEEQMEIISVMVRLGVVIWSGFIVSLNYITIPGVSNEPKDITFPASVFAGVLSSFGIDTGKKRGDGTFKADDDENKPMSKKEMQQMMASQSAGYQTIRVEQPIKILGAQVVEEGTVK